MGANSIIPDWVRRSDPTGQVRPSVANDGAEASTPKETQTTRASENTYVPIVYGGPERLAGRPYTIGTVSGQTHLVVSYILCEGEVESITDIQINDAPVPIGAVGTWYTGAPGQPVDPMLAAAMPGFAETLEGTAYVVMVFQPNAVQGFPRLTAMVKGLRVSDPRVPVIAWSDNPALILADFMSRYAGRTMRASSVSAAANACDALVGTEKRCLLSLTLAQVQHVDAWINLLRQYVPGWVIQDGGEWLISVDAPGSISHAFGDANIDGEELPTLVQRGARDSPNSVEISYTDTSIIPWQTRSAIATLSSVGTGELRRARIQLPGIRRYSQAYRFAVERLNHYTLEAIEGELATFDYGIKIQPGDLATVTDPVFGWSSRAVRVLEASENDNGRWRVRFRAYEPGAYSNEIQSPPTRGDSTLPDSTTVIAPSNLVLVERVALEQKTPTSDGLARGLIYQSRIEATWEATPDAYFEFYEIFVIPTGAGAQDRGVLSKEPQYLSPPVTQAVEYVVRVRAFNTLGFESDFIEATITVVGKTAPPGDVPAISYAAEIGGEVLLRWVPSPDVDVVRYEWRASTNTAAAWEAMSELDRTDTLFTRIRGLAPGTYKFGVKAIDAVGRYSLNMRSVTLVVTTDAAAFLNSRAFFFDLPAERNRFSVSTAPLVEGGTRKLPRYESEGQTAWNTAMPSPVASVATRVVDSFGRDATQSYLVATPWDIGLILESTVNVDLTGITAFFGTGSVRLDVSTDGSTWTYPVIASWSMPGTPPPPSAIWTGAARFFRPVLLVDPSSSGMLEGPITVNVVSDTKEETGQGTSSATPGVYARILLAKRYTKAVAIDITRAGTTFGSPSVDNVIVGTGVQNSFDVYLFNAAGSQINAPFYWNFKGV